MMPYKKIALVILITLILLKVCDIFFEKGYRNFYEPYFEKMDFVLKDTSYNDVIYLGNSRANFGINPYFIDSICKTKSYNIGLGGGDIALSLFFLEAYLQKHKAPKNVVLTYDYRIFQLRNKSPLTPMFFYYIKNTLVKQQVKRFGYHAEFLEFFPYLKYCFFNDYDRTCIAKGLNGKSSADETKLKNIDKHTYEWRGFFNYQVKQLNLSDNNDTTISSIETEAVKIMDRLINICKQNNSDVIFIYPPQYHNGGLIPKNIADENMAIENMILSICSKNNFKIKRFDGPGFLPEDFTDADHVNIKGAGKYSGMLGNYLKTILQ
ncbi:MAG: hypothetical protein M3004_08755 [Bacteroidota bacterium]|nr:hypothetical protein [Bacteroidota bacterium]